MVTKKDARQGRGMKERNVVEKRKDETDDRREYEDEQEREGREKGEHRKKPEKQDELKRKRETT